MASKTHSKTAPTYRCTECGWGASKWVGRCGECQAWGTVVEQVTAGSALRRVEPVAVDASRRATPITEVAFTSATHVPTGFGELDRVLGGGIVPGAAILISGDPGVGKSTLLLAVAHRYAQRGATVLYLTAEESAAQVRLRAERMGALDDRLYLAAETELGSALGQIEAVSPDLVIVDSVQTLVNERADTVMGGPSQVKEVAHELTRDAKRAGHSLLLVGHVTKDGAIAGPRTLEHLVDVVTQFEGDRHTALRFIRSVKNRFGPTDEVGCFELDGTGIREVPDPSGLFIQHSPTPVAGTCVTVAMEGRRALPVEIQALVTPSGTPNPRRVTSGIESARVAMVLAVLEKHAGLAIGDRDVYVSTIGGVKLREPASDLAIALAVASAATGRPTPPNLAAYGEISLVGQIRPVSNATQRTQEATRLGFTTLVDHHAETLIGAIRQAARAGADA